jgi:hypothetical protein
MTLVNKFIKMCDENQDINDICSFILFHKEESHTIFNDYLFKKDKVELILTIIKNTDIQNLIKNNEKITSQLYYQDSRIILSFDELSLFDMTKYSDLFLKKSLGQRDLVLLERVITKVDSIDDYMFFSQAIIENDLEMIDIVLKSGKVKFDGKILIILQMAYEAEQFELLKRLASFKQISCLLNKKWYNTITNDKQKQFFIQLTKIKNF